MKRHALSTTALVLIWSLLPSSMALAATPRSGDKPDTLKNTVTKSQLLAGHAINLTELARQGKLTKTDGYKEEIEKAVAALEKMGRSPILLDNEGTACNELIDGLAVRLTKGQTTAQLDGKNLWKLDWNALYSESSGNFAGRLAMVLAEAAQTRAIIFVDEVPQLVAADPAVAGVLKAVVESGKVQFVSASSHNAYTNFANANKNLEFAFQPISLSLAKSDKDDFVGDKISPDLRELMQNGDASGKAKVILQSDDINNPELRRILQDNHVEISAEMNGLNAMTVSLPLRAAEQIAASDHAKHISLDRKIEVTGHIDTTTGLVAARALSNNTGLDGGASQLP